MPKNFLSRKKKIDVINLRVATHYASHHDQLFSPNLYDLSNFIVFLRNPFELLCKYSSSDWNPNFMVQYFQV